MCDTLVAFTKNGMFFGKNSDREPSEVQNILVIPAQDHTEMTVKCTYIEIPQVPHTYEIFISQPYWIWGAEMGVNEFGVCIGNENNFSKGKLYPEPKYLLGMDLLRLALERSQTAQEALVTIISLLEKHGQGGSYSAIKSWVYNNSYLIADASEAYVLETVDRMWAWKRITDSWSISNGLSLTTDFDATSPDLIWIAKHNGWTKSENHFNFQSAYSKKFWYHMAQVAERRNCTGSYLKACKDDLQISDVMEALRSHGDMDRAKEWNPINSRWISVCAHASGTISPTFTAGSMVAWVPQTKKPFVFDTGSSNPCVATFKFVYSPGLSLPESYHLGSKKADLNAYCWNCEHYNRVFLLHYHELFSTYFKERSEYESELVKMILSQNVDQPVIGNSFAKADEIMNKYHIALEKAPPEPAAKKALSFWRKWDKTTGLSEFYKY